MLPTPPNPLLTLPTHLNLLDVQVDGVSVSALIDTGAHVSVMSADLRNRLKKILTPPTTPVVRVADGGTAPVIGMCAARVSFADRSTIVLFTVIAHCPHDIILGLDFLSAHSALIDCSASTLRLDLPVLDPSEPHPSRLSSVDFVRLPPSALTYVDLVSSPPVPDGHYIAAPMQDVLLTHGITVPHTVLSVTANCVCLPVVNFGLTAQVLPRGMSLAQLCSFEDHSVASIAVDDNSADPPLPSQSSTCAIAEIGRAHV